MRLWNYTSLMDSARRAGQMGQGSVVGRSSVLRAREILWSQGVTEKCTPRAGVLRGEQIESDVLGTVRMGPPAAEPRTQAAWAGGRQLPT